MSREPETSKGDLNKHDEVSDFSVGSALPYSDDPTSLSSESDVMDDSEQIANHEVLATPDMPDSELDATRLYLSEIGYSQLLSVAEEIRFARLAQQGDLQRLLVR